MYAFKLIEWFPKIARFDQQLKLKAKISAVKQRRDLILANIFSKLS